MRGNVVGGSKGKWKNLGARKERHKGEKLKEMQTNNIELGERKAGTGQGLVSALKRMCVLA
jgi:hypothetical protein